MNEHDAHHNGQLSVHSHDSAVALPVDNQKRNTCAAHICNLRSGRRDDDVHLMNLGPRKSSLIRGVIEELRGQEEIYCE